MSDNIRLENIINEAKLILNELAMKANIQKDSILVIGCSTSEVIGSEIGTNSDSKIATALANAFMKQADKFQIHLAVQCCEHLNRAIILPGKIATAHGFEIVSVVPKPNAGGSFATAYYNLLESPVAAEFIKADAGIDIGDTFVGMHLKHVAVPLRLSLDKIGQAHVTCAFSRPKYIGGQRAQYF